MTLDFIETQVIFVEHLACVLEIEQGVGAFIPRELENHFEVASENVRLRRGLRNPRQPFELPLRLLADVVGKICFVETFAQKLGLGSFVVGLAELLLDGPHLLAQQHLALLLGHLVLHFARDVSTDLQDSCLVLEVAVHQPKPVREVIGGEKLLRFVELETHDRSEHVEPAHAILFGANELRNVDRCLRLCKRKHFRAQRFHFALERLDIRAHVERNRRGLELGAEKRLFLRELLNPNSRRTLNEHLNATCGHGREAPDHGFRSDIEEEFMKHVADRHYMEMSLIEAKVSESSKLKGLSIADAQFRADFGVTIVAIRRGHEDMLFNPGPKEQLMASDVLVLMGHEERLMETEQALSS